MPQRYYLGYRSLFVTLTAWAAIVIAALACAVGALQQALLASWGPGLLAAAPVGPLPAVSGAAWQALPWVVGLAQLLSAALMVAAVGLLLRLEWARRAFIALLVLALAADLGNLWLQQEMVQAFVWDPRGNALQGAPGVPGLSFGVGSLCAAAITLAATGWIGWVIRRLQSPHVRQEFAA